MDKSSQEIATVETKAQYGKRKKLSATKKITYIATLVAASLVLKIAGALIKTDVFTLSFAYIPWIVSAVVMGPVGGMIVAAISDVLGAFISGYSSINPVLTLSCAMFGLIMGLVFKIPKLPYWLKLLIGTAIVIPVCTLGLGALGMWLYYSNTFWHYVLYRLPQTVVVILNSVIALFVFPLLKKLKLTD